ncbi:MAG: hypothetical protein QM597_04190 [Aeromicrobium sp.]|uniref:hypothetical protein n=1 Tax=Aeromicrobium sp. TaxID=1871063 RepID=UPI0039E2A60F
MRWQRLFDELEASVADEEALEREALVHDLVDEEWAQASSCDLIWGGVAVEAQGAGWIEGRVQRASRDFVVVEAAAGGETVVARSAILGWRGGAGRAPQQGPVTARLGWTQLLRALRDDDVAVVVRRTDGSVVSGQIEAVAADAVRLGGLDATAMWTPFAAIATLRPGPQ